MKLDPQLVKRFQRFRSIKRGYYSFLIFSFLCLFCMVLELFVNSRALLVHYDGRWYFPTLGAVIPGNTFGLGYQYETNYRELALKFASAEHQSDDFVLLPFVPYNAHEVDLKEGLYPPTAPSVADKHFLGTDRIGRDVLARLAYGFRTAIFFAFALLFFEYLIGISIGCAMGYFGGWFDMIMQRMIEIWSNIPFLYVVIIISSLIEPTLGILIGVMVFFGWVNMTWYMRTETYREKARDYVLAAKTLGASNTRILFKHILPNTLAVVISFIPFSVSGGMVALVSLDFLGFGLPASEASVGELLNQGIQQLDAYWILGSVITTMVLVLMMVTFVGEAIREAFDPKSFVSYE